MLHNIRILSLLILVYFTAYEMNEIKSSSKLFVIITVVTVL